jgi:hypothetical protein
LVASLQNEELLGLWLNNQGGRKKTEGTVLLRIVLAITEDSNARK